MSCHWKKLLLSYLDFEHYFLFQGCDLFVFLFPLCGGTVLRTSNINKNQPLKPNKHSNLKFEETHENKKSQVPKLESTTKICHCLLESDSRGQFERHKRDRWTTVNSNNGTLFIIACGQSRVWQLAKDKLDLTWCSSSENERMTGTKVTHYLPDGGFTKSTEIPTQNGTWCWMTTIPAQLLRWELLH